MGKRYTLAGTGLAAAANERHISTHAATAKAIRATLKAAFPTVTFTVTSESFSMGNAVDIRWTDGPTSAEVDALTRQHQCGHALTALHAVA